MRSNEFSPSLSSWVRFVDSADLPADRTARAELSATGPCLWHWNLQKSDFKIDAAHAQLPPPQPPARAWLVKGPLKKRT